MIETATQHSFCIIDPVGQKAGLDHYDMMLLSELGKAGCKVALYSNFETREHQPFVHPVFPFRSQENIASLVPLAKNYRKALTACVEEEIKTVILHIFHFNLFDEWVLKQARKLNLEIILIVHDVENFVRPANVRRLRKLCHLYADIIVVHNEFTREELTKLIGAERKGKIHVIPHGNFISLATKQTDKLLARRQLGWKEDRLYILFFGMIKPTKGLDILLDAFHQIEGPQQLVIAGRTRKQSFAAYNRKIKEKELSFRTELRIRYIPNEERHMLFSAADIIVLPYKKIYQSGVLLMAMSYGLPVIASDLPPNAAIIVHKENGLLFPAGNSVELARQIQTLMQDDALREKLGANAKEFVSNHNDWRSVARSFNLLGA